MKRNKTIGYLLAFFLGSLGIHAIYYKKYVRGIIYAIITIFINPLVPLMVILGWIDMFFISKWHDKLNELEKQPVPPHNQELIVPVSVESKQTDKQLVQKVKSNSPFYREEEHILDKYNHLQTPQFITDGVQQALKKDTSSQHGIIVTISSNDTTFVLESYNNRNVSRHKKTREIPLQEYWTTFRSLNERQLNWYMYWRTQVLNKNYIDADLSYIILFVYELMNYSFNRNAAFNVSVMKTVYEHYNERQPKLTNYLPQWIADLLYELNEPELAKEWDPSSEKVPQLYTVLEEKFPLEEVSMNTWNKYIKYGRKSAFFNEHRSKVYNVFKKSAGILESYYDEKNESLIKQWFVTKEVRQVHNPFRSAVIGREFDAVHIPVINYRTTDQLHEQLTALMKYAENTCREMNGISYRVKVNKDTLPEQLQESIKQTFLRNNELNKIPEEETRFKEVNKQLNNDVEEGSPIPPPPKDDGFEETTTMQTFFDTSRIDDLAKQTDELVDIFAKDEGGREADLGKGNKQQFTEVDTDIEDIFSSNAMEEVDYIDFIESLNEQEIDFINLFSQSTDCSITMKEATQFVQPFNIMLGVFLSELNNKANECLGDVLFDTSGDVIELYEEFTTLIEMLEEGVTNEN